MVNWEYPWKEKRMFKKKKKKVVKKKKKKSKKKKRKQLNLMVKFLRAQARKHA